VPSILQKLSSILERVAANPANPAFNHTLFDCIAATVKFAAQAGVPVELLEQHLNPTFEKVGGSGALRLTRCPLDDAGQVLTSYLVEFMPYVLQIMAQILVLRDSVPPHYVLIFEGLLTPTLWESRANVPALVSLLEAYMVGARFCGPRGLTRGGARPRARHRYWRGTRTSCRACWACSSACCSSSPPRTPPSSCCRAW
jgi:hypothetical protein